MTDNPYKLLEKADQAYDRGDWVTAEEYYKIIEKKSPRDAYSKFRLGNVYANQGRYDEAIVAYRKAIAREPNSAKIYNNLAVAHIKEAERAFGAAVMHLTANDNFGTRVCELLGEVRSLNRNTPRATTEPVTADWCKVDKPVKTGKASTDNWLDKSGPPMTVVVYHDPPKGACTPPTNSIQP